jgi:hypothetical protein
MAPSIRNWYANESSRDRGGLAHDWENDEPYERTPDSWLDDLELTRADGLYRRPAPRQRSVASGSSPRSGAPAEPRQNAPAAPRGTRPAARGQTRPAAPRGTRPAARGQTPPAAPREARPAARGQTPPAAPRRDVAASGDSLRVAVHVLRTLIPGIGAKGLTRLVRGHGWPSATKVAVQSIIEGLQSGPRPAPAAGDPATLPTVIAVMRSAAGVRGGDDATLRALRRCGWAHVTRAQVAAAQAPWHASSPSGPAEARRVDDRSRMQRAEVCPSCNTAISVLATCRCS